MSLKERFLKSIEELNRLLGIGVSEDDMTKNVAVEEGCGEEREEEKSVDFPEGEGVSQGEAQLAETEAVEKQEAEPDVAQDEAYEMKSTDLVALLQAVEKTAEKAVQVSKQFTEAVKVIEERENAVVNFMTKSISALCESVDALSKAVEDLQNRLARIEKEPVRKSVAVVNRFQEETSKKNLDPKEISSRLAELVMSGKVPIEQLALFDTAKSIDVLSEQTKKLLNL